MLTLGSCVACAIIGLARDEIVARPSIGKIFAGKCSYYAKSHKAWKSKVGWSG